MYKKNHFSMITPIIDLMQFGEQFYTLIMIQSQKSMITTEQ